MEQFVRRDGEDPFVQNNAEAAPAMYGHLNAIVDVLNTKSTLPIIGDDDPTGVATPNYIGELFIDTTNVVFWIAKGLTDTDWIELVQA